jgi:hypothetical protein
VTCLAVLEIPCGPYDLRTSFEQLSRSAEAEALEKLSRLEFKSTGGAMSGKPRVVGLPAVIGYRADLEGALPMKASPLNELTRAETE